MNSLNCPPELFEALSHQEWLQNTFPNAQNCVLTHENIRTLHRYQREAIDALYAKYTRGGSSPRKTYLHIAQKYTDVDIGYSSYVNE